jgi:hypothetical protein
MVGRRQKQRDDDGELIAKFDGRPLGVQGRRQFETQNY